MPTKQEISDQINTILGTKIDFTVLKKEDLDQLSQVFTSGAFLSAGLKGLRQHAREKVLKTPLGEILNRDQEKGGLFGFGILPVKPIMARGSRSKGGVEDEHSEQ